MSPTSQDRACEACGHTISADDIRNHAARRFNGHVICPACVDRVKHGETLTFPQDAGSHDASARGSAPGAAPEGDDAPVRLVDEPGGQTHSSKIRAIGEGGLAQGAGESNYTRPLDPDSPTATRCKTFHCKLTDAAITYLNEQVNRYVDENPDVRIKFVNSAVGVVEGKHADPHLVMTIFY